VPIRTDDRALASRPHLAHRYLLVSPEEVRRMPRPLFPVHREHGSRRRAQTSCNRTGEEEGDDPCAQRLFRHSRKQEEDRIAHRPQVSKPPSARADSSMQHRRSRAARAHHQHMSTRCSSRTRVADLRPIEDQPSPSAPPPTNSNELHACPPRVATANNASRPGGSSASEAPRAVGAEGLAGKTYQYLERPACTHGSSECAANRRQPSREPLICEAALRPTSRCRAEPPDTPP